MAEKGTNLSGLHYLAHNHPDLGPGANASALQIYALNKWVAFFTGDLYPAVFTFFNLQRFVVEPNVRKLEEIKKALFSVVDKLLSYFDLHLNYREYILGNKCSIADAYAVPMIRWARLLSKSQSSSWTIFNPMRGFKSLCTSKG